MKMSWNSRIQLLICGAFFVLIAALMSSQILHSEAAQLQTLKSSVEVPAIVISTHIDASQQEAPAEHGGTTQSTVYEGVVTYKYKYKNKEYESSQRGLDQTYTGIRSLAENDIAQYRAGQKIKAFIDPGKPSDAVLSRSVGLALFGFTSVLSVFGLLGASIFALGLVGAGAQSPATPAQQFVFDTPVAIWALAIGQQFYTYFTNCSPPYSVWAYALVTASLAFFAFLVRWRLIERGMAPGFTGHWNSNRSGAR